MIKKSRFVLAVGAAVAIGAGTLAYADGVSENEAFVDGSIKPAKLDKKKYKPVSMFSGVRTETNITGAQQNPVTEYLSYPKNVKFDLKDVDTCSSLPPSGSTAEQARAACPNGSYLGSGHAEVWGPGNVPTAPDVTVSVFHGPQKNGIQLHTFSPTLGPAAPTVLGSVVKSNAGSKFGNALSVPNAPETGALMIVEFNANIEKKSKAVVARCKNKTMTFQRKVTYHDGSSETAEVEQKCKRK